MPISKVPDEQQRGSKNHVCLFDPDGTRIELMEPNTVDGKPTLSSPARAPR